MKIDGPMDGCWILMQYERLREFCSYCGKIGHNIKDCDTLFEKRDKLKQDEQYGSWMRFNSPLKKAPKWPRKDPVNVRSEVDEEAAMGMAVNLLSDWILLRKVLRVAKKSGIRKRILPSWKKRARAKQFST